MAQDIKTRAFDIFIENLELAKVDQSMFRRRVIETIMVEFSTPEKQMSHAASAAQYNSAKKKAEGQGQVAGLGRPAKDPSEVKHEKGDSSKLLFDDCDCYTVLEIVDGLVRRTGSFLDKGLALQKLAERRTAKIPTMWKLIQGLGPNVGDVYKLADNETELA